MSHPLELELPTVASCHVSAGTQTWVFWMTASEPPLKDCAVVPALSLAQFVTQGRLNIKQYWSLHSQRTLLQLRKW